VGILFRKGRIVKKFPEHRLLEVLLSEVRELEKRVPKVTKMPKVPKAQGKKK
jgi:hypothetical protein